jgi:adenine specific DNA methylase Mod
MPTLDWIGKKSVINHHREVPYRLLKCDKDKSFGDPESGNLLVQGDNLEALKALLPYYAGKVKCIYIDPPYNTGNEGWIYNDNVNSPEIKAWLGKVVGKEAEDLSRHDKWLCMMYPRLRLLREFLREDGSIWISIDDNEAHGLKLLCDEIFGRTNFIANIVWQSKDTPGNNASEVAQTHNHTIAYKKMENWRPNLIPRNAKQVSNYKNPDNDSRGDWLGTPMTRAEHRDRDYYPLVNNAGREVWPPKGSSWRRPPDEIKRLQSEDRIYWGKNGDAEFPVEKKFLNEVKDGVVPQSWWDYSFAGSTRNASAESKNLFQGTKAFDTPKPEKLIYRIFSISSNVDDLVLDSFAGSGTTGAVAHKMGRRHISVEMGDHATTHIVPRYQKVISGDDQGGISESVGWQGGGGFRYCTLGEPLFDADGNIADAVSFSDLAAHVFFCETGAPIQKRAVSTSPFIGTFQGRAIYLLYAKDSAGVASVKKGNVLDGKTLDALPKAKDGNTHRVIYAEGCTLSESRLRKEGVTFKHIPYQIAGA